VDTLARLQVAARRLGCSIRVRGARPELSELLDLAGLTDLVASEH
jgi:anti-anti-sigma regulatory factor